MVLCKRVSSYQFLHLCGVYTCIIPPSKEYTMTLSGSPAPTAVDALTATSYLLYGTTL